MKGDTYSKDYYLKNKNKINKNVKKYQEKNNLTSIPINRHTRDRINFVKQQHKLHGHNVTTDEILNIMIDEHEEKIKDKRSFGNNRNKYRIED